MLRKCIPKEIREYIENKIKEDPEAENLKPLLGSLPGCEEKMVGITKELYERISEKGQQNAVDWKNNVADWINAVNKCDGTPILRTRYAGNRWVGDVVLGSAYRARRCAGSKWFKDVPDEDVEKIESGVGDWRWVLEKYGE